MASAVFGAKLRTWMSKMRGNSSNNNGSNSKDSSPTKESNLFDFETGCGAEGGPFSLFNRPCSTDNNNSVKQSKKARKRRKLNCMTVSNSQSFDRIRQQLYEEEYGQLASPNGNSSAGRSGAGAAGCATVPWDPRVPPYHPQFAQTPARVDVTNKRGFQAPRSVSLSSPESAYGSGNSEDSLTPASSTHPDLHHHHFPGRQFLLSSGQSSYSSLRQHSNINVASGTGSTRSVDRPKIKTNPWVSFQRQLQMQQQPSPNQQQSLDLQQQAEESPKQAGPNVARAQSLSFRDRPANQAKRAQSFRTHLFAGNHLKKISSESESDWDEDEGHEKEKKDSPDDDEDEDPRMDNASSSADAVCGSSKMNKSVTGSVSASPMKSLTFAGEKGFMMQFAKYNSKALMLVRPDRRVPGKPPGKTVNCPNCFLMSRHHLDRKQRRQPKPALDSQLCAYCRSWILAEEDSSTDVDTDSDFNETGSTTSSSSGSPVGAGRSKKRQPLSSYHFGAAARRRRWRKTLPAPGRNLSRELSTSCSSFLFEGDFGNDKNKKKPKPTGDGNQAGKMRFSTSDSEDDPSSAANTRSSGNGNRSAMASTSTAKDPVPVKSRSALSTPLRQTDTFWKRQFLEEPEYCVSRYDAASATPTVTKSAEDPIGYKTLLSSMEALIAKFADPGSPVTKAGTGYVSTRPKSSDTILDEFGADMPPWCTSTPLQHEQRLLQAESSFNSLNQGFSSRSSLGLTANGSSCDTLTELPQQGANGANLARNKNYYNLDSANGNSPRETDWANGNGREFSPLKDLSSPMGSVETGSVVSYTRKPADFRSRYTEEPLIKCRVEEENDDPLEALHLPHQLQNQAEDPLGGSSGDRRSFNSLEEKLKKLRRERMLLEAKIREARDEDRRRRKEKTSL